ncbi:MAG: right-handed parallel beta-helix repeat-containing protein [Lentisphaerae bacterium]|nr:right-handed parallel beta-helix repeat-containing protein [Lentisphaerota bacterium]
MIREHLRFLLRTACLTALAFSAYAADITVNPGERIQTALDAAQPGDSVIVRGGVYYEQISFPRSGNADSGSITLRAYPGENPRLDGQGRSGQIMILIDGKSYLRIMGLEIQNSTGLTDGSGIRLLGACQNIEILSNVIHDLRGASAMAITVYGTASTPATNITIRGNQVYDCDPAPSEAIALNGNISGFEVALNTVHDVNNIGIDLIGGETDISPYGECRNGVCRLNRVYRARSSYEDGYAAGIYVDGGRNIVVERNCVYECDVGLEVGAENSGVVVTGVVVRANLIFNNDKAGLAFGGYDASRGRVSQCRFNNNVCYKNDTLQTGNGELWIQWASSNVVENNIFYCGAQNLLLNSQGGNQANGLDYNLWFSEAGAGAVAFSWNGADYAGYESYRSATTQDAHSVFADPAFSAEAATNFSVTAASPVINAGDPAFTAAGDETDYAGNQRVVDGRIDIGAYEYNATANPAPTILANGATGTVILGRSDALRLEVALAAGGQAGQQADWWVVAQAPGGWYYYDYVSGLGWRPGVGVTFRGELLDLPNYEILNIAGLAEGTYVVYFGVDTIPDGQVSYSSLYYSSVTILVQ